MKPEYIHTNYYIHGYLMFRMVGRRTTFIHIIAPENGSSVGNNTNTNIVRPTVCRDSRINTYNIYGLNFNISDLHSVLILIIADHMLNYYFRLFCIKSIHTRVVQSVPILQ